MNELDSMTAEMRRALARVREAGVVAPEREMLAWIRAVRAEAILSATLAEIRDVASAF